MFSKLIWIKRVGIFNFWVKNLILRREEVFCKEISSNQKEKLSFCISTNFKISPSLHLSLWVDKNKTFRILLNPLLHDWKNWQVKKNHHVLYIYIYTHTHTHIFNSHYGWAINLSPITGWASSSSFFFFFFFNLKLF